MGHAHAPLPPASDPPPPSAGRSLLGRAALACAGLVLLAGATAGAAGLLEVGSAIDTFKESQRLAGRAPIEVPEVSDAEAGEPQTIMLLGSDKRKYGIDAKLSGGKDRSDTILLVRVDPHEPAISVLSIPRDLKVDIPGASFPDKINSAYERGGPRKTVQTVKRLFGPYAPGGEFEINHVIEINFTGFQEFVNRVGCVYVDVDRKYYNVNDGSPEHNYASIDVPAGYQRLCGKDSLDYVRYRHLDTDFVRAARQQDFLRQMKGQPGVKKLLNFDKRETLLRMAGRYVETDKQLQTTKEILTLLKLAINASKKPVRQVRFRERTEDETYVIPGESQTRRTVEEFYDGGQTTRRPTASSSSSRGRRGRKKRRRGSRSLADVPGLENARMAGENLGVVAEPKARFPFYFPRLRWSGSQYPNAGVRTYSIRDETGKLHRAYRITASRGAAVPEYYGIQGTTWRNPPILDNAKLTQRVRGRTLRLAYDGRKLRLVAYKTPKAVYWISNTLGLSLSNRQMLAIAASFQRVGQ